MNCSRYGKSAVRATVEVLSRAADRPVVFADDDARGAGLIAMIGASWLTMQQPTVSATRRVTGAGGFGRSWTREERAVTLVDLRPPVEHEVLSRGAGGRVYTHRWVMRGFWRQQPYGPGRAYRRSTWVPSHIKGPKGAPLIENIVWVWRR